MISILAQERLLGAALGSILTGVVIFEHRKSIYKSISQSEPQGWHSFKFAFTAEIIVHWLLLLSIFSMWKYVCLRLPREHIFGRKSRQEFAHIWNKSVDKTLGPLIESLSSRGW